MLKRLLTSGVNDKIVFTVTPTDSSRVLTLQDFTEPFAATVDWGDGSTSRIVSNTAVSHTYADNTPRQVTIRGRLGGFWNSTTRAAGTNIVTSVDEISSESLVSFGETFRQCTSLKTLPTAVKASKLTDFSRAFYQCKSIESSLPAIWLTHASAAHASCFTQCFLSLYGKYGTACSNRSYVEAVAGQTYYEKYGTSCSAATHHAAMSRLTYYQQYGTGCSYRSYVAAVAKKTYYEKYGTSCPRRSYVAATAAVTYKEHYGSASKCPNYSRPDCAGKFGHLSTCTWAYYYCKAGCNTTTSGTCGGCGQAYSGEYYAQCSKCTVTYTAAQSAYYKCTTSGSKCKGSSCTYTYQSAQSAYYKCTQSGTSGITTCGSSCNKTYQEAQDAYYSCGQSGESGATICSSSCARTYQAAQSAYYKCIKSNATCTTTDCEYPYANEADVTAARNAGWA